MDEHEWGTSTAPDVMLRQVGKDPTARKIRLVGYAWCDRVSHRLTDSNGRAGLALVESFIEGVRSADELESARHALDRYLATGTMTFAHPAEVALAALLEMPRWTAGVWPYVGSVMSYAATARAQEALLSARNKKQRKTFGWSARSEEGQAQCELLRCIFGNPFRPVAFDPSWQTEAVVALAAGVYADRAFGRLPVLADALEDAGCANPDVLGHCRSPGPHARGCWVVDLVLGKA